MPTFGFSAFLKLISLNSRPQFTAIRDRSTPSLTDGGYDFHRSLKRLARRLIVEGEPLADLLREVERISREPERKSAKAGLEKLARWRSANPGRVVSFGSVLYESPGKYFKVQYQPNFGIELDGRSVAVHLWNTARPDLDERMTYGALSLFPPIYSAEAMRPDDVAVLSLPESRLYRLSDVEDYSEVGLRLVKRIDDLFVRAKLEPRRPSKPPKPPKHPPGPPIESK